jgi:hypothetical protein
MSDTVAQTGDLVLEMQAVVQHNIPTRKNWRVGPSRSWSNPKCLVHCGWNRQTNQSGQLQTASSRAMMPRQMMLGWVRSEGERWWWRADKPVVLTGVRRVTPIGGLGELGSVPGSSRSRCPRNAAPNPQLMLWTRPERTNSPRGIFLRYPGFSTPCPEYGRYPA